MIEARIVLLETPECNIPDEYRDAEGRISIIVESEIDLNIKEKELTKFDKLISNFTNSFTQELCTEDQYKLQYAHHKRQNKDTSRYRGYLVAGGIKVLDGFVLVTKTEEKPLTQNVKYSFQIIGTHQLWKEGSRQLRMCDINAEANTVIWNESLILDRWMNNAPYQRGGPTYYPLLANFGKYLTMLRTGLEGDEEEPTNATVSVNDIRILNYLTPAIKQGFCQLGYEVKSRFLDSDFGRRQAGYHMGENYPDDSIVVKNHLFQAKTELPDETLFSNSTQDPVVLPIDDDFTAPCFDRGDTYVGASGVIAHPYAYHNNTRGMVRNRFTYEAVFNYNAPPIPDPSSPPVRIHLDALIGKIDSAATDPPLVQLPISTQVGFGIRMNGYFDLNVPPGYYVKLSWWSSDIDDYEQYQSSWFKSATWSNERLTNAYLPGDEININKTFDPDLTLEDILFDSAILYNWRFRTHESTKTVEFEPDPSDYNVWVVPLEQFISLKGFQGREQDEDGYIDLTKDVNLCEWIEKDMKQQRIPVSYLFKFKDHSDEYDLYQEFTEEEPPLARLIRNENGNSNQLKVSLKTYEPTLNDFDVSLSQAGASTPYVPFMWGGERGSNGEPPEPSNKLGYRIFCVLGWVEQFDEPLAPAAKFIFEDTEYSYIPTVFQFYPIEYAPYDPTGTLPPRRTQLNNIFGSTEIENELFTQVYGATVDRELHGIGHFFMINMTNLQLHCWESGMLLRLLFDNGDQERFNGFYSIQEINKTVNRKKDATVKAIYLYNEDDCPVEVGDLVEEDPCNIDELLPTSRLWVDATDINADGSATADGTQITTWKDKSNDGKDLVQIGSQSVPVKFTSGGREIVEFTSDQLQSATPLNTTTAFLTVFIVSRTRLLSGNGVTMGWQRQPATGPPETDQIAIPKDNGDLSILFRGTEDTVAWGANTADYNIWLFRIGRWNAQFPRQEAFNRNSLDLDMNTAGGGNITNPNEFILGRSPDGGQHQHINIGELIVFSRALSAFEIQCIFDYLSDKWNIQLE